ncbi:hypothetical protein P692DRAFT_20319104 [Suillus brevipes Sb2]|nr:hypothetical protein P692DRAFT_20319104 [Suillus brevipes Sb2]
MFQTRPPCYDRLGNIVITYLPASVQTTRSSHVLDEQINAVVQINHIILDVLHLALVTKPWMICDFNIPNEWLLGRDHNENELERGDLFSDNSHATSSDEACEVAAPFKLLAEEDIGPLKRCSSLPTEECSAPVKRRRASQRLQPERGTKIRK